MSILVLGSMNLDFFFDVDHFVKPGETLMPKSSELLAGGKGLNQAIACSKAGSDTKMAGKVGPDGLLLIRTLEEAGTDIRLVRTDENLQTGKAVIQRDPSHENCILLLPGANHEITPEDLDAFFEDASAGDLLLLQNEISSLPQILERARRKKMKILFNPAPYTEDLRTLKLSGIHCLIANQAEASALTNTDGSPEKAASIWISMYPESSIVITLSRNGAYYKDRNQSFYIPAFPVQACDSTGAGDVFTGYLASGIDQGLEADRTLKRAAAAAALSVTRKGAAASVPSLKEVEKFESEFRHTSS